MSKRPPNTAGCVTTPLFRRILCMLRGGRGLHRWVETRSQSTACSGTRCYGAALQTVRGVGGFIPHGIINPSGRTLTMGSTQAPTEMSTRDVS